MKKLVILFLLFGLTSAVHAQSELKVNWEQLGNYLSSIQLKEFSYQKGSLYNEAEGVVEDEEIPGAVFYPTENPGDKNLVFILSIQPAASFAKSGIIEECVVYSFQNRKCYYRETPMIQCLYMDFEKPAVNVCIIFRKPANHDQKFIEGLFDEMDMQSLLNSAYKN